MCTDNAPSNAFKNSYALLLRHAGITHKDLFIPLLVLGKLHDHVSRESQVRLVHGQVFASHVNEWWDHAWVEIVKPYQSKYDILTLHWQLGLDATTMPYPDNRLRAQRRYTVDEALALGVATGHFGPWRLSTMEAREIATQI